MGSKATARTNRYHKEKYDTLCIRIPKGQIARMREASLKEGKSVNKYVVQKLMELIGEKEGDA